MQHEKTAKAHSGWIVKILAPCGRQVWRINRDAVIIATLWVHCQTAWLKKDWAVGSSCFAWIQQRKESERWLRGQNMTKLALCLLQCLATLLRTSLKDQLLADLAESKQHLNCIISWSLSRAWPVITNSLLGDQRSASVHALRLYNYWHEAFLKDWQTKSHLCIFFPNLHR